MVPEPVAFRVGGEQREEELQLILQVLREVGGIGGRRGRVGAAVGGHDEGRKERALQDLAAVVPDGVELGVELEQLGGEAEGGGRVVVCASLLPAPVSPTARPPAHSAPRDTPRRATDLFLNTAIQLVIFYDLLELAGAEMLIAGLGGVLAARDAVLGAASARGDTGGRGYYAGHGCGG